MELDGVPGRQFHPNVATAEPGTRADGPARRCIGFGQTKPVEQGFDMIEEEKIVVIQQTDVPSSRCRNSDRCCRSSANLVQREIGDIETACAIELDRAADFRHAIFDNDDLHVPGGLEARGAQRGLEQDPTSSRVANDDGYEVVVKSFPERDPWCRSESAGRRDGATRIQSRCQFRERGGGFASVPQAGAAPRSLLPQPVEPLTKGAERAAALVRRSGSAAGRNTAFAPAAGRSRARRRRANAG